MKVARIAKKAARPHLPAFIFLASFGVYLFTLCPTFYWRDSAEFIDAAFALGVAHPAGFPTYLPLANLMTYLPLGPIAFKINLLSALMGAAASTALFFLTQKLITVLGGEINDRALIFSSATALTFAFSFSLWESSVSSEVYAGMGAASAVLLLFSVLWAQSNDRRWLFAGAFLFGLTAGLHGASAFFLPALLVFVIINYKGRLKPADLIVILFFFFVGFSAYIYLPLRSAAGPNIDWGNPRTLAGFLIQILDKKDTAYHFAVSRGGLPLKIGEFLYVMVRELTILWPVSALFGLYLVVKKNWRLFILLILFFLAQITFFIWYWSIGTIYIPSYVVIMATGGAGLHFIAERLSRMPKLKVNAARILTAAAIAFVFFNLLFNYGKLDKSDYYAAEDFTLSDYQRFDYRAMVVTNLIWPNFYCLQDIDRLREDLIIVAVGDIIQPDYFNRFTPERFPTLVIPQYEPTRETGVAFLKTLIFKNYRTRAVYIGPDEDIVMKLSYRLLPEVLFFKMVTEKESQNAPKEYYEAYLERLDAFAKREIESQGPNFFDDEVFVDYYRIIFTTISAYLIDRGLWDVELEALRYSASFDALTTRQMVDTGIALLNRGEFADAEVALRRALEVEPGNRSAHVHLGHVLVAEGRLDEARAEFKTVLRLGREEFQAYYGMGLVSYREGRFTEAAELFKKAGEKITTKTSDEDKEELRLFLTELRQEPAPQPKRSPHR